MAVTAVEEENLEDFSLNGGAEEKSEEKNAERKTVSFRTTMSSSTSNSYKNEMRQTRMKAIRFQKSSRNRILSRKLSVVVNKLSSSGNPIILKEDSLDFTRSKIQGGGILAAKADIELDESVFAEGCKVLLACARGDLLMVERLLKENPNHKNFRDYDRRTAMHIAASEGYLAIVEYLVKKGAKINRSDRWGGSPLDDAHRHQHLVIVEYLRKHGGSTGSADQTTYLFDAVADGDSEEVAMLIDDGNVDLNEGDYDKRRPLHVASSNGDFRTTKVLVNGGAKINVRDRWGSTPLDEAIRSNSNELIKFLKERGAISGGSSHMLLTKMSSIGDASTRDLNLSIDISEVEMIERIGAGAFGEIYKCRWKGTLVAAKCIKSAKIQKEWLKKYTNTNLEEDPVEDMTISQSDRDLALEDFRQETAILSKLRHPNICMLLAFTTTQDHEVMISELMKCSLLDVFKANFEQKGQLSKRTQLIYCSQLAKGMNYLHTFKQPIIHRDLKPANLLVDYSGTLKITDFGLAKVRPNPNQEAASETDKFLMTGETGSYRFMAPEVFRHEQYTETVDVYSFAMIVYYIFRGVPPWPYWSGFKAVNAASFDGSRPEIPREWHAQISTLLQMCWDENMKGRPSFATIIDHLHVYSKETFGIDCDALSLQPENPSPSCCVIS